MKDRSKRAAPADNNISSLEEYHYVRSSEFLETTLKHKKLLIKKRLDDYILDRLNNLEKDSRPSGGSRTAVDKDKAAFDSISLSASLMSELAGWAIDHQKGLAIEGLDPAVPIPQNPTKEFLARRHRNDKHIHEKRGHLAQGLELTSGQARQLALNFLRPMSRQFNFLVELVVALEALQYGETMPILKPSSTRKRGLTVNRAKLIALCYMAYEKKKGINKNRTVREVAEKFAANTDSVVRTWTNQTRKVLGVGYVDQELSEAEQAAERYLAEPSESALRPYFEEEYGRPALLRAAAMYRRR